MPTTITVLVVTGDGDGVVRSDGSSLVTTPVDGDGVVVARLRKRRPPGAGHAVVPVDGGGVVVALSGSGGAVVASHGSGVAAANDGAAMLLVAGDGGGVVVAVKSGWLPLPVTVAVLLSPATARADCRRP